MRRPAQPIFGVVLTALALAGCSAEKAVEKPARPVKVQVVEQQGTQARARYSANIAPYGQVLSAFKASGYVRDIRQVKGADGRLRNLQEGDQVSSGMELAKLRDSDYVESVNAAKSSVAEAQAGFEKYRLDFERADRLFQSQSLTKQDHDAARAALDMGRARLEGARAQLAQAEIRVQDTSLVAPSDGVILKRQVEVGTLVGPGTVGFIIADTHAVKAMFGVPDWLAQQARLGMNFPVTIESLSPREFTGQITAIAPNADTSSRLFEVELTIRNPQNQLKPGLIATVEIPEGNPAAAQAQAIALVIPLAAVVKPPQSNQFGVYVVEAQGAKLVARLRPIEVGEVYGNMVAVRKGLQRGERVIVTGASLLTDNEAVQIIP